MALSKHVRVDLSIKYKAGVVIKSKPPCNIDYVRYSPSIAELVDFNRYLKFILKDSVERNGLCVIKLPKRYKRKTDKLRKIMCELITRPWIQRVLKQGKYHILGGEDHDKPITLSEYRALRKKRPYSVIKRMSVRRKEKFYWNSLNKKYRFMYALEQIGTLFSDADDVMNPNKLGTLLDLFKEMDHEIPGVTSPMVYFGLPLTCFG